MKTLLPVSSPVSKPRSLACIRSGLLVSCSYNPTNQGSNRRIQATTELSARASHWNSEKGNIKRLSKESRSFAKNLPSLNKNKQTYNVLDLSRYECYSVNDQDTLAHITDVFDLSRNLQDTYEIGQLLGRGSFGAVRLARDRRSGELCAIKSLPKLPPKASRKKDGDASLSAYLAKLDLEVETLNRLKGTPQAVQFRGGYEDNTQVHIAMELCRGGSLQTRLNKEGPLSEKEVASVMYTTLQLLESCHNTGIVYRDIKPENFMYLNPRAESARQNSFYERNKVKVVDFGQSIHLNSQCEIIDRRSGTPVYMAPEVIKQCYGAKADIWCSGMMMYQLLSNRLPFWTDIRDHTLKQVWTDILLSEINFSGEPWNTVSDDTKEIISLLLSKNPKHRPSATEIMRYQWFEDQLGDELHALKNEGKTCQPEFEKSLPYPEHVRPRDMSQFTEVSDAEQVTPARIPFSGSTEVAFA